MEGYETSKSGSSKVPPDNRDGLANPSRALGSVEAVLTLSVARVEESEAWRWGLGDCWNRCVLGASENGERCEGQQTLEIHG